MSRQLLIMIPMKVPEIPVMKVHTVDAGIAADFSAALTHRPLPTEMTQQLPVSRQQWKDAN